jgi:hypothetical protein
VICDEDEPRALSLAFAVCDVLGYRRGESVHLAGQDWRAGEKDPPPLAHVYETARAGRALVV